MKDYKTKDEILQITGISISNLESNPTIAAKLLVFGFTSESLAEGKRLVAIATEKSQKQKKEVGEQHSATERCNELFNIADVRFKVIYKISRVAITEKGLQDQLGIVSLENCSFDSWAQRRIDFYTNALSIPVVMERLARFNIKAEDLVAAKKMVEDTIAANQVQLKETGEARMATNDRDDAFETLKSWYDELRLVAKLALDKRECEILGL
jgi:hypothetical protein